MGWEHSSDQCSNFKGGWDIHNIQFAQIAVFCLFIQMYFPSQSYIESQMFIKKDNIITNDKKHSTYRTPNYIMTQTPSRKWPSSAVSRRPIIVELINPQWESLPEIQPQYGKMVPPGFVSSPNFQNWKTDNCFAHTIQVVGLTPVERYS